MHPTYRYLERSPRLAGLTWRQWLLLVTSALATYVAWKTTPLPSPYNLSTAITVCGMPAAAALALSGADRHLALSPRVLLAWWSTRGVYLP